MNFLFNENFNKEYFSSFNVKHYISQCDLYNAVNEVNEILIQIKTHYDFDLIEILGMRNLSSVIGEILVTRLSRNCPDLLKNPHQDGYPDLLLMDDRGLEIYQRLKDLSQLRFKEPFSPFENGGLEVKATCGVIPSARYFNNIGLEKLGLGDQRLNYIKNIDWKAHHRQTNNLVGVLWDFINSYPTIVAVFFSSNLNECDWGAVVQPREGGGRTTSVSIMNRLGVGKMIKNYAFIHEDYKFILDKYRQNT